LDYRQARRFLDSRGNEVQALHLGLHRIRALMRALGDPHLSYRVLHVAGTNGKGSVSALAESILRSGGLRTGLYTSPHLEDLRERIVVSGRRIGPRRFAALMTRVRRAESRLLARGELDRPLTFFELVTACGFLAFAQSHVEVAVVEVGLGGRLDATNIVRPAACAITTVALDHQAWLGSSLAEIAAEKAGIIKPGIPVVTGCRRGPPLTTVRKRAKEVGAPVVEIDRDCHIRVLSERQGRFRFDLETPSQSYRALVPALRGEHQVRNAAVAVAAVEALGPSPVRNAAVRSGLARARWPGRLDEYAARRRTLLDGAHNVEAAQLLRRYLEMRRAVELHLVFAAMGDKDIGGIARILFPLARTVHVAPLPEPRAATPQAIASAATRFAARLIIHRSPRAALDAAWRACSRRGLVVVTGSLYLIGALLPMVRKEAVSVSRRSRAASTRRSS
jgi:dihydrofolate synthase/folylpolyglutamate synthase